MDKNNAISQLASTLLNGMNDIANNEVNKAQYDKSYYTYIVGVNQHYIKDVSEDIKNDLINKYSIPQTSSDGKYYTFIINGMYYVVKSESNFNLYENVLACVVNNNWNRICLKPLKTIDNGVGIFVNENKNSEVFNDYSNNFCSGDYNHIEGQGNKYEGDGYANHIEGAWNTCTGGYQNHIEGQGNKYEGRGSGVHIGGSSNTVNGEAYNSGIFGQGNVLDTSVNGYSVDRNLVAGYGNRLYGGNNNCITGDSNTCTDVHAGMICGASSTVSNCWQSIVCGHKNTVSHINGALIAGISNETSDSDYGILVGNDNTVSQSDYSIIGGRSNTSTSANESLIIGYGCEATSCSASFVGGYNSKVLNGNGNLALGSGCVASGGSIALGSGSSSAANAGFACGVGAQTTQQMQTAFGTYNDSGSSFIDNLFMIGNGNSDKRSNALNLSIQGNLAISGTFANGGADYAEYYEWLDGNIDNEDRRGLFVTLDGDKIVIANSSSSYILGVISGNPSVIGNSAEMTWYGRYERDVFGTPILNKEGRLVVSSDYDNTKKYIPRSKRKEYSPVGTHGQLIVVDDGTCEVNGYCIPNDDGKATKSDDGYRVIKRIDETHIKIVIK